MKNVYLENTTNHHDKFYSMVENNDGASFTATWGKIGGEGRTQVYGMNEWDKKYNEKINKGYKSQYHNKPTNWIQGMSVAQRKKQGITTVSPPKKAKKKPKVIKKTARKIHYDVGQVDVEVNHSHMNKLRILHMTMENWQYSEGAKLPLDSRMGRMFEADLDKVDELMEQGKEMGINSENFLLKEDMMNLNVLFKTYGGKRVTQ